MPTREVITDIDKSNSCVWMRRIWDELYWCRLDTVLISFLIEIYELSLVIYTPVGSKANHKYLASKYKNNTVSNMCSLRNLLAHNLYTAYELRILISEYLTKVTQPVFIDICDTCGLPGSVVWDTLIDMCYKDDTVTREYITPTLLRLKTMSELIGE